jgi:protoporphyrinogen oxidase
LAWQDQLSRRKLLNKLAQLIATTSGFSLSRDISLADSEQPISTSSQEDSQKKNSARNRSYKIAPWTGDDFTLGHKLRKKQLPKFPDSIEAKVDFVIVGGGMAGLAAAHYLRHQNYLLLEQYDELGGQSRGDSWNGLGFSYGSALIANPSGQLGELLSLLDLKPVRLDGASTSWLWQSHWFKATGASKSNTLDSEFAKLFNNAKAIWRHCQHGNIFAPISEAQLLSLDTPSLSSCLTGYSAPFLELINSFCQTYLGAGIESVSALAGLAILENLVQPSYVLPGGNSIIVKSLANKLLHQGKARLVRNAFTWSIELKDDYSLVTYSTSDGVCHKVQARHVIVTTPHLVSARLFSNLNDATRLELFGYRYCSYLIATLLLKRQMLPPGYAHFVQAPFSFTEMASAETPYELKGQYKSSMGSALTIYQPYEPASKGRELLLAGDRESFSSSIVEQVEKICPGLNNNLERIILTRWGHALAVAGPGYFSKLNKLQSVTSPCYSLAHSSSIGLPRIESAVQAAHRAADRALKIKPITPTLYSLPGKG